MTASDSVDFVDVVFYDSRNCVVVFVARFTVLEEYVRVFVSTTSHRAIWIHSTLAEVGKCFTVQEWFQIFLFESLNLLDFVRSTETVEEVQEWNAALDSRKVSNC